MMPGFWYLLLLAHFIGDYLLQSDWMAIEKTKKAWPALAHASTYTLPFVFLWAYGGWNWGGLAIVFCTHYWIDRYRLARFVVYAKNYLAPCRYWYAWPDCDKTGYHNDRPAWLATWLLIIADNTLHLGFNALAVFASV